MNASLVSAPPSIATEGGSSLVRFFSKTLNFKTEKRVELYNITALVADIVREFKIKDGFINVSTLHTTTAMFVNEFQKALLDDIKVFLGRLVDNGDAWKHNNPEHSDCDRGNADSHLLALLLNHSIMIPITDGKLSLGQWQSIVLAELDGPRERTLTAHAFGGATA